LGKIALTILKKYDFNKKGGGLVLGLIMALLALFIDLQFDFQIADRPMAMLILFLIVNSAFLARDDSPLQQVSRVEDFANNN
ncbi:MAG TPA: hypothetical protein GXZ20_03095, partial [Halanaerobiaceae bacterium]|nr:hypothetical protein [Halanaerobiaceae bacterium]